MSAAQPGPVRDDAQDATRDGLLLVVDPARRVRLLGRRLAPAPSDIDATAARMPARSLFAAGSRDAVDLAIQDTLEGREARVQADVELAGNGLRMRMLAEPLHDSAGKIVATLLSAEPQGDTDAEPGDRRLGEIARLQRREAIGQLAMGIAHDFNNLLSGVGAAAESLAGLPALTADANAAGDVAAIRQACARASSLVRQLLSFGNADARAPRCLDVDAAVSDVAQFLKLLWKHRARLVLDLDAAGCAMEGDPTEFEQIIVNLALNARDAMLDGGTLTVRTRRVTGETPGGADAATGRVAIEIADTGIGIMPDVLPRIFDPFFTTKRARGGTGLGLATVRNLIRRVGGTIGVESVVGTGTCFRLVFPDIAARGVVPERTAATSVAATPRQTGPGATRHGLVLLVDDDDLVRRMAERALAKAGWTVLPAASGEAALDVLATASGPLRALVTDLSLPGMDGEAVLQAVRDHVGEPQLPVVVASGLRTSPAAAWAAQGDSRAVNVRFVAKPYLPSDLVATLDALLVDAAQAAAAQ